MDLSQLAKTRLCVIGDVMLDRYSFGETSRISPEAPVPIVRVTQQQSCPGGAGNVALNLAALGAKAQLHAVTGRDEAASLLQSRLRRAGVEDRFHQDANCQTIIKQRVISRNQQIVRLDFEEKLSPEVGLQCLQAALPSIAASQAVILSDYAKGVLVEPQLAIEAARAAGVPIVIDPKRLDLDAYRGASMLTPNRKEFEAVVGPCADRQAIIEAGLNLMQAIDLSALLITLSADGMLLLQPNAEPLHLSAHSQDVYDVTGAGDTVVAVCAAAMAAGYPLATCAELANLAAGLVVQKLGAASVSIAELNSALLASRTVHHVEQTKGVITPSQLLPMVNQARADGEQIVLASGGFDVFNEAQLHYLQTLKQQDDCRLIVALYNDTMLSTLFGADYPVHNNKERAAVIAALRDVDWVVEVDAQSLATLIQQITPEKCIWPLEQEAIAYLKQHLPSEQLSDWQTAETAPITA